MIVTFAAILIAAAASAPLGKEEPCTNPTPTARSASAQAKPLMRRITPSIGTTTPTAPSSSAPARKAKLPKPLDYPCAPIKPLSPLPFSTLVQPELEPQYTPVIRESLMEQWMPELPPPTQQFNEPLTSSLPGTFGGDCDCFAGSFAGSFASIPSFAGLAGGANFTPPHVPAVPEPATYLMLLAGLAALAYWRKT